MVDNNVTYGYDRNRPILLTTLTTSNSCIGDGVKPRPTLHIRVFSQTPFRTVFAPHGLSSVQEW